MILSTSSNTTELDLVKDFEVVRLISQSQERKIWKVHKINKQKERDVNMPSPAQIQQQKINASAVTVTDSNQLIASIPGAQEAVNAMLITLGVVHDQINQASDKIIANVATLENSTKNHDKQISAIQAIINEHGKKIDEINKNVAGLNTIMALIKEAIKN